VKTTQTSLEHFRQWMEQQVALHEMNKKLFSQRDAEILAHAYVRTFPNRLHLILAELTINGMRTP
jgi:hypothetical protein